ncbi:MAG: hypothetical protein AAGH15_16715 [Myxococcota bacterium]
MQRHLPLVGTITLVSGLWFALGGLFPRATGMEAIYEIWFMGDDTPLTRQALFGMGLFGAITACMGAVIRRLGLGIQAGRVDVPLIRRALLEGLVVWFIPDNIVSVATGAYPNVGLNVVFLLMLLLPILALPSGREGVGAPAVAR